MEAKKTLDNSKWESVVFGNRHNAVYLTDAKHRYVRVNTGAVKLLGYSEQEFLDLSVQDILTEYVVLNDGYESQEKLSLKKSQHGEVGLRKKDGSLIYCHYEYINNFLPDLHLSILSDISEQKKLKERIDAEHLRFQKMFTEAPVSMCILKGKQLIFESANTNYYNLTGRSKNIIGKPVREVFPEMEGQPYFDWLDKVYNTGETFSANESPMQLDKIGDGNLSNQYINFMYQPFHDENGKVDGIFYFGVDVTEQVLIRKKIEESEKRHKALIENLPAAIYTTNAEGKLDLFNTAAIELWGRQPQIKTDKFCGAWKIFDLDRNVIPHDKCGMAHTLKTGEAISGVQVMVQRPSGEFRYVSGNIAVINDDEGRVTGAINVMIDITEKKKAEEELKKLSLIAEKTDNAVIIRNSEGKIEWVNEGFTKNTEFSFSEAIGKSPVDLLHGTKTNKDTQNFIAEKMKKLEAFECEILRYKKSGTPFWVEKKGQPIVDSKGDLLYYFEIESDITQRKEAFDRLKIAESQVRTFASQLNNKLEEERSRIAREIHDELGQQLSGLKMSLTYLKKLSTNNQKVNDLADSMKEEIDTTMQSLREFATELRPGILDSLGLIDSLVWLVNEFRKKTNIHCSFFSNLKGIKFDEVVSINVFRICQEALNNILKHANATSLTIDFNSNNNQIVLSISDNGRGIANKSIINPFSMGLLGMRERAKLIGGELTVSEKKGTTVQLVIDNYEKTPHR